MTKAGGDATGTLTVRDEFGVRARTQRELVVRRFLRHRLAMVSLVLFLVFLIGSFVVPHFWAYSYTQQNPHALSQGPSAAHPFGTDTLGQDVLAESLRGIQTSIKVSFLAMVIGEFFGIIIGAVAGLYRGWIDSLLMRAVDVILTLPAIAIVAVLAKVSGGSWWTIGIILGGLGSGATARLVRGVVLSLREREYIEAARALGATDGRIIWRHLLPNSLGVIIVDATLVIAVAILTEAALSFIGFGIHAPDVSLGSLVNDGVAASQTRPWLFYFPGLVLILLVLTINFVGDGLRDALDPTQQRVRA